MKRMICFVCVIASSWIHARPPIPTGILPFEERGAGVSGEGRKVSDILFAELLLNPDVILVDRDDFKKQLGEQEMGATGLVKSEGAAKLGQLTGAKLLISGSVIEADNELYLVARITSSETGKMQGAKVVGSIEDELGPLVRKLADEVSIVLSEKGEVLVPEKNAEQDPVEKLKPLVEGKELPSVYISVAEEHIGRPVIDPAVETELSRIFTELGFEVIDSVEGKAADADIRVIGEGFSEFAARKADLISVKARIELKMLDTEDKVMVYDRQTTLTVGVAEHIAGKTALQEAAEILAMRMLPKLMKTIP